ncbi:MAG: calcium-binding protein [Pseudomonadota bacterium]
MGDTLDGGRGTDLIALTSVLAANTTLAGFTASNIEGFNVNLSDGDAANPHTLTVNLANAQQLNSVQVSGTTAATANDDIVTFNNLVSGVAVTVANSTNISVNANYTAAAVAGAADTATLNLNTASSTAAGDGVVAFGAGFETLTVNTSGAASSLGALTFGGTRLNIVGDQNLTLRTAVENATTTVTVTGAGALTATLGNGANTMTGGDGNDVITAGQGAANESISLGLGNDTLILDANLALTDTLTGGDGTDTLSVDIDLVDAAGAPGVFTRITGFETLNLRDGGGALAGNVTTANISADINRINISTVSGANNNTFAMGAGTQTLGINVAAAIDAGQNLTVTAAGTGTSDSLAVGNMLTAGDLGSTTSGLNVTGFESVSINTGTYATAAAQNLGAVATGTAAVTVTGGNSLVLAAGFTGASLNASALAGTAVLTMSGAATTVTTITGTGRNDVLRGDTTSTLNGLGGADSIFGGTGADTINGGAGNDTITGNGGNDVISGDDGNDAIDVSGAAGAVSINGGLGDDTLTLNGTLTATDTLDGGDGTDTLAVTAADITTVNGLNFTDGVTLINNISNIERISFGALANSAVATNIVDMTRFDSINHITVTADGDAATQIGGIAENATVVLSTALGDTDDLTLALASTTGTNTINLTINDAAGGDAGVVTIAGVELVNINSSSTNVAAQTNVLDITAAAVTTVTVTGNALADFDGLALAATTFNGAANTAGVRFQGTAIAQAFTGSAAADSIVAAGGADTVNAGAGNDTIDAGTGNDVVNGEAGNDDITGGAGLDTIDGGAGNDTIAGGADVDSITGGEGSDSITGGTGADVIVLTETTAARDTLVVGNVDTTATAFDVITGFTTGTAATADVIDFGSAIAGAITAANGEAMSAAGRFTYDGDPVSLAAVVALLETLARADGGNDNGTFFFEYEGSTYVGELTANDPNEFVSDLVQLVGVTGMTTLTDVDAGAAGTAVTLS